MLQSVYKFKLPIVEKETPAKKQKTTVKDTKKASTDSVITVTPHGGIVHPSVKSSKSTSNSCSTAVFQLVLLCSPMLVLC